MNNRSLGVYLAIRHWSQVRWAQAVNLREILQLAYISEFTNDLRHVKGKNNADADTFSRIQLNATFYTEIDFQEMARAQADVHETQCLKTGITILKLAYIPPAEDDNLTLLCDVSKSKARPVLTE